MKKLFLSISALFLAGSMFAQTAPVLLTKEQAKNQSVTLHKDAIATPQGFKGLRSDVAPSNAIGQTYYDLQTNGSLPQRIVTFADGTTAATWTTCGSNTNSRGAGYNYFDGSAWINPGTSTDRIETVRGGWPTIAALGDGEIVVSHNGSNALIINVRSQKGTGAWTETLLQGPTVTNSSTGATSTALLWPSVATSGNIVHLIACTESDEGYLYEGIQTALVYFRGTYNASTNTITWENPKIVGDMGNHTDWFDSFGGDNYVIATNGNTVAVVVAGQWTDAFMWKSTDNGVNWTSSTIVNSYIPDNYDMSDPTQYIDTAGGPIYVTDGATALAIGNDGKVHVAFGLYGVNENEEAGDGYYSGYPLTDGMLYWNEDMAAFPGTDRKQLDPDSLVNAGYTVFFRTDLDGDGSVWYLGTGLEACPDNYHNIGLTSQPSLAVDGNNVYLVYTSVLDLPFYDVNTTGMYYRGIFGVKSTNGGASFEEGVSWLSYNKNCYYVDWSMYDWNAEAESWTYESIEMESENIYPSVSNIVNGKLNVIWHNDYFPDNAAGSVANNPTNVLALSINADQLGVYNNTTEIPQGEWIDHTGIADNTLSNMVIFPNPATTTATVAISSTENTDATVTVFNLMGQMVYNANVALIEGVNNINLSVNDLGAGIYMINVKTIKGTSTQKLIVK